MIKNFFVNNWKIKLVSLLIAFAFWIYVSAVGVKIDNFPGGVNLELRNIPEGMVAITDTQTINVSIAAELKYWSALTSDSVFAYVNCSNLSEGTYELLVTVDSKINNIEISEYTPQKVLVRIEPKSTKTIPVNIKIEGSAAEGLVPSSANIEPSEVEINGPKSVLDQILEATAIIKLDGETQDVNKKIKLVALNSENQVINGVSFAPSEVSIKLPIVKAEDTKTVGIKVLTTGSIDSGRWISDISINPSTVTITGQSSILKTINYIETKPINIEDIDSNVVKNIELNIPSGITLVDQISSVSVSFTLEDTSSSKIVQPKITTNNIQSYLRLDYLDPIQINVLITGPQNILNNLNPNDIVLNLNLGNFYAEGEYYIDITKESFNLPDQIDVLSFNPSSIKAKILRK